MSKIKDMINQRMNELALRELQAEEEAYGKRELVSTSVRLYGGTLKNLDVIGERMELKRSDLIRHFLDASVREALIELNIDPLDWEGEDDNE